MLKVAVGELACTLFLVFKGNAIIKAQFAEISFSLGGVFIAFRQGEQVGDVFKRSRKIVLGPFGGGFFQFKELVGVFDRLCPRHLKAINLGNHLSKVMTLQKILQLVCELKAKGVVVGDRCINGRAALV